MTRMLILQKDTTGLTTENSELKLRLQAMEQQDHLRDGTIILLLTSFNAYILHVTNISGHADCEQVLWSMCFVQA